MIDLTGANLVNYLLRMIRDIVERNPRWKQTLGEVTFPANTIIRWGDVWISITSVTTSGNRLSPSYFMLTQIGRAILAKVGDKDGQFIEWTREVDPTNTMPASGVYYLNVDFFDDRTRDLGLTVHKFRWVEGNLKEAVGTVVNFRAGIDLNTVVFSDSATSTPVAATTFNQTQGGFAYLITPTQQLAVTYSNGLSFPAWDSSLTYAPGAAVTFGGSAFIAAATTTGVTPGTNPTVWTSYIDAVPLAGQSLTPLVDFWYQRPQSAVIIEKTVSGSQLANIPSPYISVTFTDQDGYVLRQGIDYTFQGPQWIVLSQYTPPGSTITANMVVKLNPSNNIGIMPENYLQVNLGPNEKLAPNQVFIHTTAGTFTNPTPQADGSLLIPQLLQPGDYLRWEVRIDAGQFKALAKKWEITNLPQIDPSTITYARFDAQGNVTGAPVSSTFVANADPSELVGIQQTSAGTPLIVNGQQAPILPGLRLAIGDNVVVGDQCAIIVSPSLTETYEVYGSKENLSFTLEIKANDLQTSSDLAEMIKAQMLIMRRINTEADGLTIFEATRSFVGQARDTSATAPSYVNTVTVSASADWKVYVPLVTRMTSFEIKETTGQTDFLGKLQMAPRMIALGTSRFSEEVFIPSYR
jgi:hypothetical protein